MSSLTPSSSTSLFSVHHCLHMLHFWHHLILLLPPPHNPLPSLPLSLSSSSYLHCHITSLAQPSFVSSFSSLTALFPFVPSSHSNLNKFHYHSSLLLLPFLFFHLSTFTTTCTNRLLWTESMSKGEVEFSTLLPFSHVAPP